MKRARITIAYCTECLYLPRAIDLAQSLLLTYADQLESLTLIPGHEGVFDVTLNEQKIFVMEGVLPKPDKIVKQISNALAGRDAA